MTAAVPLAPAGAGRLRRVDSAAPGYRRRRAGRGFCYLDQRGRRIADAETLERIRGLAIPPAWTDVWICPDPFGHLQATGVDAAGRRQYRYHDRWRERRDRRKFDRMLGFAAALPALRERVAADLARTGPGRERVLACAVRLLDLGFFRVGTESYAERNGTFGLATLRREHVTLRGATVTFDYPAKGGLQRVQSLVDPEVVRVLRALLRRTGGGPELLAYRDGRRWVDVRSADVNAYLRDATGGDWTAKDFRTWHATVLCAVALAVADGAGSPAARRRAVANAICETARYLGNTPAVCRASYVDPRVVDRYLEGVTVRRALEHLGDAPPGCPGTQGGVERAVLALLDEDRRAAA